MLEIIDEDIKDEDTTQLGFIFIKILKASNATII